MRLRTMLLAGAMCVGLAMLAPVSVSANVVWCAGDPPVLLVTPGGKNVMVNNYLYVAPMYKHLVSQVTAGGTAVSDGAGGSLLVINVHVPRGMLNLTVISAQQKYQVKVSGNGSDGQIIQLTLDVPIP